MNEKQMLYLQQRLRHTLFDFREEYEIVTENNGIEKIIKRTFENSYIDPTNDLLDSPKTK